MQLRETLFPYQRLVRKGEEFIVRHEETGVEDKERRKRGKKSEETYICRYQFHTTTSNCNYYC